MKGILRGGIPLLFLFSLLSCASSPTQEILRRNLEAKDFGKAHSFLEKSELKEAKRHYFLYLLEKGQIFFREGKYEQAVNPWNEARQILRAFYERSTKDQILSSVFNDNYRDFHGEFFEQHQLFFHLSLAYLKLYHGEGLSSKEKVRYLNSAKAVLLDWDSFIQALKRNGVKEFYRESFLARFYASLLHEMVGSRNDLQIAYQLMKDALKIEKDYKENGEGFPILGESISSMMGKSLMRLASKLGRKKELKSWEKKFGIRKKDISLNPGVFFVKKGMVAAKKPVRMPFSLTQAFSKPSLSARSTVLSIGLTALDSFSSQVLGLNYYVSSDRQVTYLRPFYGTTGLSVISFEVPVREEGRQSLKLPMISLEKKGKKYAFTPELLLSISDLARASLKKNFESIYFKTGFRVATKYILAILGAYQIYQGSLKSSGKGGASLAASLAFSLSSVGIQASERADTRYWSTLEDSVFIAEFDMAPGKYQGPRGEVFEKKSQGLEIFSLFI